LVCETKLTSKMHGATIKITAVFFRIMWNKQSGCLGKFQFIIVESSYRCARNFY
jgi:hypothetical protein